MRTSKRPLRADAQRNYDRILAAAGAAVAAHGTDASLEEIAREAGVGSATLHRHFPSRQALLEAVFRDRVETLCAKAADLAIAQIRVRRWSVGCTRSSNTPRPTGVSGRP